ncbi:MAG TPA: TonB family protein [Bryobacteraceae bacterium]|nr:TonB family protein [Bryobacteraceae bacterium]HPU72797.1 TonB family protein [Bryobacteraceae bacterium]
MEVVVQPGENDAGLRLLVELPAGRSRAGSWAVSLLLHAAFLVLALLAPPGTFQQVPPPPARASVTTLVAPPTLLTQREPNRGAVAREVGLEDLLARRRISVPPGPPALARTRERKAGGPEAGTPEAKPAPRPLAEPPQIAASGFADSRTLPFGPGAVPLTPPPPPPPQIQPEEKPKLAFESPRAASSGYQPRGLSPGRLAPPSTSVTEAARAAIRSGGGGQVVGDYDLPGGGGLGGGLSQLGSPGNTSSALELLSDPMGVDFKPYLIRILATVKRNWLVIIPESARMGRRGRVQIQFAIARDGTVPRLVIATPSGTEALDRAAVAGISASTPFPPLPAEFPGSEVRLQFTFTYNMGVQNRIE